MSDNSLPPRRNPAVSFLLGGALGGALGGWVGGAPAPAPPPQRPAEVPGDARPAFLVKGRAVVSVPRGARCTCAHSVHAVSCFVDGEELMILAGGVVDGDTVTYRCVTPTP